MQRISEKIKLWLYGYGHMGKLHAKKLKLRQDIELSIIDPGLAFPLPEGRPDAAIICTPTQTHLEIALPLLQQGIPCLVEKPLAATVQDARQLADYPHLCVGHIERFGPVWPHLRLKKPRFIQCERLAPFSGRSRDIDVIQDLMIHDLDLCLALMGEQPTEIRAIGIDVLTNRWDMVNARLEFPNGVAQLTASRVSPKSLRQMRIFGSNYYDSADFQQHRLYSVHWTQGKDQALQKTEIPITYFDPLEAEHQAFFDFVRLGKIFPCSGRDGVKAVALALAIQAAV